MGARFCPAGFPGASFLSEGHTSRQSVWRALPLLCGEAIVPPISSEGSSLFWKWCPSIGQKPWLRSLSHEYPMRGAGVQSTCRNPSFSGTWVTWASGVSGDVEKTSGGVEIFGGVVVGKVVWDETLPPKTDCQLPVGETRFVFLSSSPFPASWPLRVQKLGWTEEVSLGTCCLVGRSPSCPEAGGRLELHARGHSLLQRFEASVEVDVPTRPGSQALEGRRQSPRALGPGCPQGVGIF